MCIVCLCDACDASDLHSPMFLYSNAIMESMSAYPFLSTLARGRLVGGISQFAIKVLGKCATCFAVSFATVAIGVVTNDDH